MSILFVVNNPADWPLHIPGVHVVAARSYITDPAFSELRGAKVFNLCRSYRYQATGYYVSLLAEARGHRPLPSIPTIQDLKSQSIIRVVTDDVEELIQKNLASIQSDHFTLSVYFGRNVAKRYDRLAQGLFNLFPAPLLRAEFNRKEDVWELTSIEPIGVRDMKVEHQQFAVKAAQEYFTRHRGVRPRPVSLYDIAILRNEEEEHGPSNDKAIQKFVKAADDLGISVEIISKEDYGRVAEFDALFIRETTSVNHHTYRFARRAAAEGLVVVDDPESILKCSNKVYLAELLDRYRLATPKSLILHKDNVDTAPALLGFPLILKQPDSAFSQGVIKVEDPGQLADAAERMLERSDLVIAQEFLPTTFDWRVGVFDGKPLYVCKYFMAKDHWQIIRRDEGGRSHFGNFEAMSVEEAPQNVVRTALRAAGLIGDGLYGVDLKQSGKNVYVIEVNDNPNIDAGVEDKILKDRLYAMIMEIILQRIEARKAGARKR